MRKYAGVVAWSIVTAWLAGTARADVKPHALFGNGMVLQQGMDVPVWGTADDGERVQVSIQLGQIKQEANTTAKDGKWKVKLANLPAGGPHKLVIAGKNTVTIEDVLVGEVWVCSGQSNMEWPLHRCDGAAVAIAEASHPQLRLFTVPKLPAKEPLANVIGKWSTCTPESAKTFSAVAYYFGRNLHLTRKVPIGLIHTSWGGTAAEAWTRREALEAEPELAGYVKQLEQASANYPKALDNYILELEKALSAAKKAREEGKDLQPFTPNLPVDPYRRPSATTLYNGMIAPLIPYAIRGAIWYQGESNAGRAKQYRKLFPTMIENWRKDWGQGDFPFLYVQLAPFKPEVLEPQESDWAESREAQWLTLKLPKTGMAVITDHGDPLDIHPRWKEPVGERLALLARDIAYGEKIVSSGPLYDSHVVEGDKIIVSFKHVGGGLISTDGPFKAPSTTEPVPRGGPIDRNVAVRGFTICGEDGKFVNAEAKIVGDKVAVSSAKVAKPKAVRFGWADAPRVNLYNKEGLPASPFRTDDFPMVTDKK